MSSRKKTPSINYNKLMELPPIRLGFLASHNGTDMRAIVRKIKAGDLIAKAEVVISNNSTAPALEFAHEHHIPGFHISSKTHENPDQEIVGTLLQHGVELVICAGYMKVIQPDSPLLKTFKGKLWNAHPADTKKYGGVGMYGERVHQAVLDSDDKYTYPTIHVITGKVDGGPILAQGKVEIDRPHETVETLKPKVQAIESQLYIDLLNQQVA